MKQIFKALAVVLLLALMATMLASCASYDVYVVEIVVKELVFVKSCSGT